MNTYTHTTRTHNADTGTHMHFPVTQCSRQPPSVAVLTIDDRNWVSGLGDDWGDGRVNSEECGEGKTRTRRQSPSPPAVLGWVCLSMSHRPVSSFALLVFLLTTSHLFLFFSPLKGQSTKWVGCFW